jgi:hypothetical protein
LLFSSKRGNFFQKGERKKERKEKERKKERDNKNMFEERKKQKTRFII